MSDSTRLQDAATAPLQLWFGALRPRHWVKNLLLVAPVIFGQAQLSLPLVLNLCLGFLACSLAASAGYLVNDVADRHFDRLHASKRFRPIAAGLITPTNAVKVALALSAAAVAMALLGLGPLPAAMIAAYLLATVTYSIWLKRRPVIDVLVLAGLYVGRMAIGGAIAEITVSSWLLAFGYSLFVALALAKRLDEIVALVRTGAGDVPGRAYGVRDLQAVRMGCWLFGALALATLAAYIGYSAAAETYYRHQGWLWCSAGLVGVWLAHVLRRATAGRLRGDPVVFAASDPISLVLAAAVGATLIAAV